MSFFSLLFLMFENFKKTTLKSFFIYFWHLNLYSIFLFLVVGAIFVINICFILFFLFNLEISNFQTFIQKYTELDRLNYLHFFILSFCLLFTFIFVFFQFDIKSLCSKIKFEYSNKVLLLVFVFLIILNLLVTLLQIKFIVTVCFLGPYICLIGQSSSFRLKFVIKILLCYFVCSLLYPLSLDQASEVWLYVIVFTCVCLLFLCFGFWRVFALINLIFCYKHFTDIFCTFVLAFDWKNFPMKYITAGLIFSFLIYVCVFKIIYSMSLIFEEKFQQYCRVVEQQPFLYSFVVILCVSVIGLSIGHFYITSITAGLFLQKFNLIEILLPGTKNPHHCWICRNFSILTRYCSSAVQAVDIRVFKHEEHQRVTELSERWTSSKKA